MESLTQLRKLAAAVGISALLLIGGGVVLARADGGGESEKSAAGPEADRARAAAVLAARGGRADFVERESENGATWHVEVAKPGGKKVEVDLDGAYRVVSVKAR